MAVEFQDYYKVLNVPKTATAKEIQKAYRRLARTYHPDINKEKGAEEQFKKINEAYEVLKNPEARKRYDMLGSNYQSGQPFTPPPGSWQNVHVDFGDLGSDLGGYSSFFEQFFAQGRRGGGSWSRQTRPQAPIPEEAIIEISLEEAMRGTQKELLIQEPSDIQGARARQLRVNIPPGATEGARIRLRGQSSSKGDLILTVRLKPHAVFSAVKLNLFTKIAISPWEAALGTSVIVPSLDETKITMKVPPGTQSGKKLRLRGKGLPAKTGPAGDLIVEMHIAIPTTLTTEEKELFEKLRAISSFNPRK